MTKRKRNNMRVKRGLVSKRKHNKIFELAKGYRGTRSTLIRTATQAVLQAGQYAFHGRKLKKRDFRALWITRIASAVKQQGISYSKFVSGLKKANIVLDRKILSELVRNDPETFTEVVATVKKA
jgi:large subunit ribosomal protein L20